VLVFFADRWKDRKAVQGPASISGSAASLVALAESWAVFGGRIRGGDLFINWNEPFSYLFEINEVFQKKGVWGE